MRIDIKQLEFVHSTLRSLLVWLEKETGLEFTITSLYRIGDKGVHGTLPLRGADLHMPSVVIGEQIEQLINTYWRYDHDRPEKDCAIFHGDPLHLHLQVHENTRYLWETKGFK